MYVAFAQPVQFPLFTVTTTKDPKSTNSVRNVGLPSRSQATLYSSHFVCYRTTQLRGERATSTIGLCFEINVGIHVVGTSVCILRQPNNFKKPSRSTTSSLKPSWCNCKRQRCVVHVRGDEMECKIASP